MNAIKKKYYQYDLEYYLQPGKWMTLEEMETLRNQLIAVNVKSGKNLNYGILDVNLSAAERQDFFDSANICLMKEHEEPIGFFFNLVLAETPRPVLHAGLVMVAKNSGHDLIGYPYSFMTYLQYLEFGPHYYTSISSTPSIVGVFSDSFTDVWPSYKANQIKPPSKEYRKILELLEEKYIRKYFKTEELEVDKKRFVLKSSSKEMGFETNLTKLSRYHKPEANYFCMYWLDYSQGEDLIQVGKVDLTAILKIRLFYSIKGLKSLFSTSFSVTHGLRKKHP